MVVLQGPVICPAVRSKQVGVYTLPFNGPFPRARLHGSDLGFIEEQLTESCVFSSSSDGNGSMADNFNENNADYVNSSVVEAVEVRSGSDGFMIKMRDGSIKMEDGTGLLLPIIVLEMPSALLMAAVRNVQIARPTMYQVVKNMIDKMGYSVGDETESVTFDLRPSDAINIAVRCKNASSSYIGYTALNLAKILSTVMC
ncbi:Bifunctional nuclease 1 [Hibiscus syriacus]|uniref:Bifunctional nuclease 1 n=1 Tax=Hibiscus syriacus TaxID=106335 RepID=A0A6A3CIP4_HIBSY|nr:Bifunctional nuclease 1 [Hibiscus syriacus]